MSDSTAQGSLMSSGDAIPLAALWLGSGRTRSPDQRDLSGICRHTPITDLQTAACRLVCELAARAWPSTFRGARGRMSSPETVGGGTHSDR
jgi:hypothetical protein